MHGVIGLGSLLGVFAVVSNERKYGFVTYKVEENYKMIKPMWQDFLIRSDQVRVSK